MVNNASLREYFLSYLEPKYAKIARIWSRGVGIEQLHWDNNYLHFIWHHTDVTMPYNGITRQIVLLPAEQDSFSAYADAGRFGTGASWMSPVQTFQGNELFERLNGLKNEVDAIGLEDLLPEEKEGARYHATVKSTPFEQPTQ